MDDSCFFLVLVLHAQVQRKKKVTRVYSGTRVWRHTLLKELVNTLYTHTHTYYIIIYFKILVLVHVLVKPSNFNYLCRT